MRSFKNQMEFTPFQTQPQLYSPSRVNYQNRTLNAKQNSKNKNRTQQIVLLHEEFEDLKRKIKQVQSKNEKIIEKIHRECNFKKKAPQAFDINDQSPIIYYQKNQKSQISQSSGPSAEDSNKSDQSEYQFKQIKKMQRSSHSNKYFQQKQNQSMQQNRQQLRNERLKKKCSNIQRRHYEQKQPTDSRELISNDFSKNSSDKFQMQASHQTYHHLNQSGKIRSGKSYEKKQITAASYPINQKVMDYGAFNQSQQSTVLKSFRPQEQRSSSSQNSNSQLIIYQLEESFKIQQEKTAFLAEELKSKQIQILNIKKQYYKIISQFESVQIILEDCLQQFFQNVVKKGLIQIERQLKKYQNRLRNISINIKDEYEELKSSKLIKEHQIRRLNSRSRKDLSPLHNTSMYGALNQSTTQSAKVPRPASSHDLVAISTQVKPSQTYPLEKRSRGSQQQKKNKEFEEIVQKYEEMINSKKEEISKLELLKTTLSKRNQALQEQLETKDGEIKQFKQKLEELDRLMSEMTSEMTLNVSKKPHRISSTQSNLLEDIYQQESQNRKFQKIYLQTKQQLEQKNLKLNKLQEKLDLNEKKIMEYEKRMRQYQQKIKKLESSTQQSTEFIRENQSASQKLIRQQLELSIKNNLTQLHQTEISNKEAQISKLKENYLKLQKKLVDKDCQVICLQNKLKKIEGFNELNLKKIQEYQKILSYYQHNASVDMGQTDLLDQSHCHDTDGTSKSTNFIDQSGKKSSLKQSWNTFAVSKADYESVEQQLKEKSDEIFHLIKKIKFIQKSNSQKSAEIESLLLENDRLSLANQKSLQQSNELKIKISELQQQLQEEQPNQAWSQHQLFKNSQDQQQNQNLLYLSTQNNQEYQILERNSENQDSMQKKRKEQHRKKLSDFEKEKENYLRKQSQEESFNSIHLHQTISRLEEQLLLVKNKNLQLSTQYNNIKSEMLQISRSNIALKKNNEYLEDVLSDREQKYQKYKKEYEQLKVHHYSLIQDLKHKQEELNKQKLENCYKIQELEKQWRQFEEQISRNNNPSDNIFSSNDSKKLDQSQLLKNSRYNVSQSSILLSSTIHNKNSQYLQEQNQYLTIKLKEAEATIEMHNMMEEKVLTQYKSNVDKLKLQIKDKHKQLDALRKQLEVTNDAKRRLQVLYESSKNYLAESKVSQNKNINDNINGTTQAIARKRLLSQSSKKSERKNPNEQLGDENKDLVMDEFLEYNEDHNSFSMISNEQYQFSNEPLLQNEEERLHPYERILDLEGELKQAKNINKKLQQMQEELFKQIRLKEEEKKDILRLLDEKNKKIQELEGIVELKDSSNNLYNCSHILGSHISTSNNKSSHQNKNNHNLSQRESLQSHSSLRYSVITHLKNPTINNISSNNLQAMNANQFGASQKFQMQFSQTGSQMLDKSYVTNISEIFQKEQFPYQKVQLKRKQQIKLFQKIASYIKSLKQSINDKNKRIKLLEKKIQSLKNANHGPISKQLENKYQITSKAIQNSEDLEFDSIFKDYESVQLQRKKASHNKRYKNLQHEWKLVIQQNNVLSNQVEVLQEELEKAQEQENTILVMKDLYKDQIKKLLSKNQQQTAYYENLLAKQKKKVEESQSVHNMQTIKQLFLKVMDSIIVMESQKSKRKREEKKKDLEQFFKIFASLCSVEQPKKLSIIEGIKKMTLNIVLAEESRSASKNKQ